MPKEYLTRLVFDDHHKVLALLKDREVGVLVVIALLIVGGNWRHLLPSI